MTGGGRRRAGAVLLALWMALIVAPAGGSPFGGERERKGRIRHRSELEAQASRVKPGSMRRGRGMRSMRRAGPDWPAESLPRMTARGRMESDAGGRVVVTVTMVLPDGVAARYVALDVGADPSLLRYAGHRQTGRGGLIVRESPGVPGLVSVYRSSLDPGFEPVETVVELEFEPLGSGHAPLSLSQVRVLDSRGRDIGASLSVGDLRLD